VKEREKTKKIEGEDGKGRHKAKERRDRGKRGEERNLCNATNFPHERQRDIET